MLSNFSRCFSVRGLDSERACVESLRDLLTASVWLVEAVVAPPPPQAPIAKDQIARTSNDCFIRIPPNALHGDDVSRLSCACASTQEVGPRCQFGLAISTDCRR